MVTFADNDDEVVHAPVEMNIRFYHRWGYYLNMAPNVNCVVVHPSGQVEAHVSGGLKPFIPGKYLLRYVDMREHSALLSDVEAYSKDAWRVRLTLDLVWQVRDPLRVARMADPRGMLIERCMAAIANYIQSQPYDRLIALPEVEAGPEDEKRIVADILERLRNNRALNGFRFINLSILGRQGDPDYTEIIKQQMNQVAEARRDLLVAEARIQTAEKEQQLARNIAVASARKDQELADIAYQIFELLYPAQQQLIQLEQMKQSQQMNQARIIQACEVIGTAMSQMATVLGSIQSTPGAQHLPDEKVYDALTKIMSNLVSLMPPKENLLDDPDQSRRVLPAVRRYR